MAQGRMVAAAAVAAVLALSGIGSILLMRDQPRAVEAVELEPDAGEPAIRRDDDDLRIDVADEPLDDDLTGDGDATAGDDGTSGGANTGDGDATAGDDGTSGGANTDDGRTGGGDTSGGGTTDD